MGGIDGLRTVELRTTRLLITDQDSGRSIDVGSQSNSQVQLSVWDPVAIVYVSAGTDGASGVVDVDDDGNTVVDDVSELGATGSDDRVLTPEDSGYQDAQSGKILAMVLSHGAMKRVEGDAVISGPGQVRIDLVDNDNRLTSRIIDLQ